MSTTEGSDDLPVAIDSGQARPDIVLDSTELSSGEVVIYNPDAATDPENGMQQCIQSDTYADAREVR